MSTLLQDAYTDADGTLLDLHAMLVGPGWVNYNGVWEIQSNAAKCPPNITNAVSASDAGVADGTQTGDVITPLSVSYALGLAFRVQDKDNCWFVVIEADSGTPYLGLLKRVGGSNNSVGTTNLDITYTNATTPITVALSGNSISVSVPGKTPIATTDSFLATETRHGLFSFSNVPGSAGGYVAGSIDNFLFDGTGGGNQTATSGVATVAITGHAPTASGGGTGTATSGVATVAISCTSPSATGTGSVTVTPGVAVISITGSSPNVSSGTASASPGVATVSVLGISPAATGGGSVTVSPGVATVTVSGVDPDVFGNGSGAQLGIATVAISGIAPTVTGAGSVTSTPGIAAVSVTGVSPSVSSGQVSVTPGIASVTISGVSPTANASGSTPVSPGVALVNLITIAVTASGSGTASGLVGVATVSISGVSPGVNGGGGPVGGPVYGDLDFVPQITGTLDFIPVGGGDTNLM